MSLYARLTRPGPTGFGYASTAEQVTEGLDLSGRNIVVTGCSSGLGQETCRVLARRGARIIGLARSLTKAETATDALPGAEHLPVACDLADPASVRSAVAHVRDTGLPLHAVLANAGIMALPELHRSHGYELQFFTNHVGHVLLIEGLLDRLAADGRVVLVSSNAHHQAPRGGIAFDNLTGERGYNAWTAYGQSKLANLLYARHLAERLRGTRKTANAVHPGVIGTNLGRHLPKAVSAVFYGVGKRLFMKTVGQGAATQVYVAVHPDAADVSGEYWEDVNVASSSRAGRDVALASQLQARTEAILEEVAA